ncbi:hypothetical protein WA026_002310 [Henosepilachna vigintioctopunctata]|uniref:Peptidase M14 domain-containing protein n=1 Tax=Henosepilachna vigintioctopunctata TaxID=420089 RepID=A0AAW1TZ31_9CUCU
MKRRYVYFNISLVVIALFLPCPFLEFGQYTQGRYTSVPEKRSILPQFKYAVPSFNELERFLKHFSRNYSFLASLYEVGKIRENENQEVFPIYNMVLSSGYSKPIIVFIGGLYASDLSSPLALMESFSQMVTKTKILSRLRYAYAFKKQKKGQPIIWLRNMRKFREGKAVNLLHNFGSNFRVLSNSDNHYGGEEPFSELESRIIRDYILELQGDIAAVFLLFSSSKNNALTYPHSNGVDNNSWIVQEQLAINALRASEITSPESFSVTSTTEFEDAQGGRMDDWLLKTLPNSAVLNIQMNYTVKDEGLQKNLIRDVTKLVENLVLQLYQDEHKHYYNYRRILRRRSYKFPWKKI